MDARKIAERNKTQKTVCSILSGKIASRKRKIPDRYAEFCIYLRCAPKRTSQEFLQKYDSLSKSA